MEIWQRALLHAWLISKRCIMIAFLTLEVLQENGVDGRLFHAIKAFFVPTGVSWLSNWQAIKAFHRALIRKNALCFFSSLLFM